VLSGTTPGTTPPTVQPSTTTVEPPAPITKATAASTTQPPSTTEQAAPAVTAQPPPVAGFFAAFLGATGPPGCDPEFWLEVPGVPHVTLELDEPVAEVGQYVLLCFIGFDPFQPIDVTLTGPDGSQRSTVFRTEAGLNENKGIDPFVGPVAEDALSCGDVEAGVYPDDVVWCEFGWLIRPEYRAGRYAIEARQGDTIATGAFDLVDPTEPWLESASQQDTVAPGDWIFYVLSGFEAGQVVPLAFYSRTGEITEQGEAFELHSDAGTVQVDDRGLALFEADSSIFPPGFYCLVTPLMEFPNCQFGASVHVG